MPEPLTVTEDQVRTLRAALDALLPDERITQLTDERDRARRWAVGLEQENAELARQRDRIANDVIAALPSRADVLREAAALVARFTSNDLDANAKMLRRVADEDDE
ncbi:hypothetical protein ACWIFI_06190 [Streptomyces albidoflavus]